VKTKAKLNISKSEERKLISGKISCTERKYSTALGSPQYLPS
jgi:hypothetical protein